MLRLKIFHNLLFLSMTVSMSCTNSNTQSSMHGGSDNYDSIPANFRCPITQELFHDPVMTADGQTYERSAIEDWLKKHNTSPLTGKLLVSKDLKPNYVIISALDAYKQKRQQYKILEKKLTESEKELAEKEESQPKVHAFKDFNDLDKSQKNLLLEKKSSLLYEWDTYENIQRLEILSKLGMSDKSYLFLKIEFRQKLSDITQLHRHTIDIGKGKHPSTEDYWNANKNLQAEWIKN